MKKTFTVGQVAKMCEVSTRTVTKWIDSGRLPGYRIPGSLDRRVGRESLDRFLADNKMPSGLLDDGVLATRSNAKP